MSEGLNRQAALEQAQRKGFVPEKMLFCPECGRTVIRTQKSENPGWEDKIYCTCESRGVPMCSVVVSQDCESA